MKVPVINKTTNELPAYARKGDAGMDVRADLWNIIEKFLFNSEVIRKEDNTIDCIKINPGGRALIPTELYCAIPEGYEIQVRPRSGLALKHGITVLNTPGTVDSGYRNSIGVILINQGTEPFEVHQGDRIAQFVLNKYEEIEWVPTNNLEESERGLTGFGDSGVK